MSREEAIEQLNFMIETIPKEPSAECDSIKEWLDTDKDIRNALEMAIKALEQAPDIDKAIATIDFEEKWLLEAGYNCSNVNTAFRSIKHDLRKLVKTND
jgi:uncharacterized coiled-coil DUF342 family protein